MELIIQEHKSIFSELIGSKIDFALTPEVRITNSSTYPEQSLYNQSYGHFYESEFINLRITKKNGSKEWIKLSPGPDENIDPWAPVWIEKIDKPDLGSTIPNKEILKQKIIDKDLWWNKNGNNNIESDYLDSHIDGFGASRLSCWNNDDPIKSIEIHEFNPYAGCVFVHESGNKWSVYAEYDFLFWLNFSEKMISGIRENSDSKIIIKN